MQGTFIPQEPVLNSTLSKLLFSSAIAGLAACGGNLAPSPLAPGEHYRFLVEREVHGTPAGYHWESGAIPNSAYTTLATKEHRYDLFISTDGQRAELSRVKPEADKKPMTGKIQRDANGAIKVVFAIATGAQFTANNARGAELQVYGSGLPLLSSEVGVLEPSR